MKKLLCLLLVIPTLMSVSCFAQSSVTVPTSAYVDAKFNADKARIDSIVNALNAFNKMASSVTTASTDAAAAKALATTATTNVSVLTTRVAAVEIRFDTTIRTWVPIPPLFTKYGSKGVDSLGIILKQ